uniref:DUF5675 domain-containing protein n=1 Tax=viral metagenome TaxID=1070528 RepID=A0A6M3XZ19_9ZZZZ
MDKRIFQLVRIADIVDGIFGVLKDDEVPFCVTVENNDYVFPDGDYLCKRVNSPKYGNTFEITGVSGRTHILIHWGNWEDNSLGCVIVGEFYDPLNTKDNITKNGIGSSKKAFNEFIDRTKDINEFVLKIRTFDINKIERIQ